MKVKIIKAGQTKALEDKINKFFEEENITKDKLFKIETSFNYKDKLPDYFAVISYEKDNN